MEDQSSISGNISSLFEKAGDYLETRVDLFKLQAADKSADIVSSLISKLIILVVALIFVIMLNIGLALVIGKWLGETYYGFFILAGFYLIAGLICHSMRHKWIKDPVGNSLIKKLFKQGYEN